MHYIIPTSLGIIYFFRSPKIPFALLMYLFTSLSRLITDSGLILMRFTKWPY